MWLLGIVIGFILGAVALQGFGGGLAGALAGFIIALAIRSKSQTIERQAATRQLASAATPGNLPSEDAAPTLRAVAARLTGIEDRLLRLEARLGAPRTPAEAASSTPAMPAPPPGPPPGSAPESLQASTFAAAPRASQIDIPAALEPAGASAMPEGWVRAIDGTLQPSPASDAAVPAAQNAEIVAAGAAAAHVPQMAIAAEIVAAGAASAHVPQMATAARTVLPPAVAPNPLWAWFTGGNALTRIGVVVLFFGVGFLLKYFARYFTIPIELRLAGVALVGVALIALGVRLSAKRPGYGLSLQGAGAGILYLTVYAAFRFYDVLPPTAAFVLLVLVAAMTVGLAIRNDSQPMAGLAIAGGFLAPFLVETHTDAPALLFGYFAVLNGAILAVAWLRAWRALNALGFLFTFALGLLWGHTYYTPEHFATVEPFLVLFFAFYVAIAILYAKQSPLTARAPVDALLVFGVPLVGFALQAGLVRDTRYGVAWSAFAVAIAYGALYAALRRRSSPGLPLLARSFLVLAVVFATIAIPFAADSHWTSAWWALEAAAVYWIGCEQRQPLARAFALLLQLGAAAAFVLGGPAGEGDLFLNASFLGTTLIALAGFATCHVADHAGDRIGASEHTAAPLMFTWGLLWWIGGGAMELHRQMPRAIEGNAILAFVVLSTAVALWLRGLLRWPRLGWFGAVLLPVMAAVALKDWQRAHTTLVEWGWLVWPAAWALHWVALRVAEDSPDGTSLAKNETWRNADWLPFLHAASAIALVAWTAWEASEWVGRYMPEGTVWMACAAAWTAIAYIVLVTRYSDSPRWPLVAYRDAYTSSAGTTVAALLAVWFAIVNVVSPGSPAPLPYAPLANPLDVTVLAVLAALWAWARRFERLDEPTLYGWFGVALFVFVNGVVFRTMHQWADVPWRWSALLSSKPLQAALTLTWTATALPLMVTACRRSIRPLWMAGAVLLAFVVLKLFLLDLAALSGLPRVVAFLGVGVLLLLIGYLAPLPPAVPPKREPSAR